MPLLKAEFNVNFLQLQIISSSFAMTDTNA